MRFGKNSGRDPTLRNHPGIRIISGRWRRRRLAVPNVPGLRPTPDRVRETLFNWLGNEIRGMHCLDLFAGSGALGLEAASRGAAEAVLVERNPMAVQILEAGARALTGEAVPPPDASPPPHTSSSLDTPRITIVQADALRYLQGPSRPFQLVFLDPPFDSNLLETVCPRLENGGWLAERACIYLEMRRSAPPPTLPAGWEIARDATAGEVRYALALRAG